MAPQTHLYTHTRPIRISRFIYFTGHFFLLFFFPSFRKLPFRIRTLCVQNNHHFFLLFVWIVTFYKSWQDNILPLQNKPNNNKKRSIVTVESMHHEKSHRPETSCEWKEECKKTEHLMCVCVYLGSGILFSTVDNLILPVVRIISFKWSIWNSVGNKQMTTYFIDSTNWK